MIKSKKLESIAKKLRKAGFKGGVYYFKSGECSCCFGLEDGFFQITGNTPTNWSKNADYHKITYLTDNEKLAKQFIKTCNKILEDEEVAFVKVKDSSRAFIFYI